MNKRIRIQPKLIEVPEDNPFLNDLLERKEFVETFTDTLKGIEGPAVFAIDGQWGSGKTTFVRMLTEHLKNKGVKVMTINAWETDYAKYPLVALASEFMEETSQADEEMRLKFKNATIGLLRSTVPAAIRIATGGLLNIDPAIEKELGTILSKAAEDRLRSVQEDAKSMEVFRDNLCSLAACCSDHPMIVIIDELDRCRPSYAVEMLEIIKHLFDVDNVLFVLAVNRNQLDESVRTLYGTPGDPESYFRRFFDAELRLPLGRRENYIRNMLQKLNLDGTDVPAKTFAKLLAASPYSVRTLEQTIHHYSLVRSSLTAFEEDTWWWMLSSAFLLRLVDEVAYYGFLRGEITDAELVDSLFELAWARSFRGTHEANVIEATVMVAANFERPHGGRTESVLLARYQRDKTEQDEALNASKEKIINIYNSFVNKSFGRGLPWRNVTERIEMLASSK